MCHNILLTNFRGEQPGTTYYLPPANIYGLGIHDDSNNICSVYTWTEFKGKKAMNNISSWLMFWLNEKGYCSQSYGKNHKMPKIDILVDNCGFQNKNNLMIRFLKIMK